ncbi:hypothetical protein [Shewanella salipaludis]|uniref:Uncharacterized protein n=1 Tax=Shewanella salipaludis TaxID=2723052 RepID=A0A972FVZ7_9GAMM|nr:hypothetical protein [Shewanella salipaludis]NMH63632.1 hypothetical protein [Shewanella salipaludis]
MNISTKNGWHTLSLGEFTKLFIPALSQLLEEEYNFRTHDRPSVGTNSVNWDMTNGNFLIGISWKANEDVSVYSSSQALGEVKLYSNCNDGLNWFKALQNEFPNKLNSEKLSKFRI